AFSFGFFDKPLDIFIHGQIGRDRQRIASLRENFFSNGLDLLESARRENDPASGLGKRNRNRLADPSPCPCHHSYFPVSIAHGNSFTPPASLLGPLPKIAYG